MAKIRELRSHELDDDDWMAIEVVAEWLLEFRKVTTLMSTSKNTSTLSYVQAIFQGLQDSLREKLSSLPSYAPVALQNGLTEAHEKLSEYFNIYDRSPYYVWSSSKYPLSYSGFSKLIYSI